MRWPRNDSAHPESRVLHRGGARYAAPAAAGFRRTTRRSKDVNWWVDDSDSGVWWGRGWAVNETLLSSVVDGDRVRTDHREVPSVQDVWVTYFHMLSTYYHWSEWSDPGRSRKKNMRRNIKVILLMAIVWAGGLLYLVKNGDKPKQVRRVPLGFSKILSFFLLQSFLSQTTLK